MILLISLIGFPACSAWSQTPQSPAARLRQAAGALQRQMIVSQRTLEGLEIKIQKAKQDAPNAAASLDWINSSIASKKVLPRLRETQAGLAKAQKSLSQWNGGCQSLMAAQWEPIIAADQRMAQTVKDAKKIKADLVNLHNAKLGEKALNPLLNQLGGKSPDQAQVLRVLIKTIQEKLNGSATSLEKGLALGDWAQAGGLLNAHNAYCKTYQQSQPPKITPKVDHQEKVAENVELPQPIPTMSHSDHVPTPGDFKDVIKTMKGILPKNVKISEGGKTGGVISVGVLAVTSFLTPILANSGYQPAVAALISDEILSRMKGRGASIVYTSGKDQLFDNKHFEVVDRNNVIVGTIDKKTGFIIPANWVLDLYEPSNNFLGQNKDKQEVSQKPAYSSHAFTPPPLQPWLSSEWGPPPADWDGPVSP